MAAGLGFKTFAVGEVLTAGDVNGYLMQGVLVFASATARDAAITSPQEGQFAYTKDTNGLWYYDGAAWVASGATGDIEGVTAGTGISGGGTSGTVTITNSMATAIDAKGDLVVGTGADTFSKLTVGANDTVLTADSSAATGLKWAAAAAGGAAPLLIPINSGKYIKGQQISGLNQAGLSEDTTYYIPLYLAGTTYDRIGFKSGASQTSASTIRLGIYNVGANNKPTTLVLDAGTVSASAANTVYEITISQTLNAGYYYLAINYQSGVQAYAMFLDSPVLPVGGYADNMSNQSINSQMYYQTGVSGAFATAGTLVASNDHFFMGMRIA